MCSAGVLLRLFLVLQADTFCTSDSRGAMDSSTEAHDGHITFQWFHKNRRLLFAAALLLVCGMLMYIDPLSNAYPSVQTTFPKSSTESLEGQNVHYNMPVFEKEMDLIMSEKMGNDTRVIELFLDFYSMHCQTLSTKSRIGKDDLPWCPCIPVNLAGRQNISRFLPSHPEWKRIQQAHPEMTSGGHWKPPDCKPRQHIAILIPYRDREQHLYKFLDHMIPFLQRQLTEFTIFVVEQGKPKIFNKASVTNAGFLEAKKLGTFDCFFFHDVDTLPEDDRNFYTCLTSPRQLGLYVTRHNYEDTYFRYIGGGAAFTSEQFHRINGFSNQFYGWGREDDDAYYRLLQKGMRIIRYPRAVARYTTLEHTRDVGNPINLNGSSLLAEVKKNGPAISTDGLSTVNYTVKDIKYNKLFTWIYVDLPPPPETYTFEKVVTVGKS